MWLATLLGLCPAAICFCIPACVPLTFPRARGTGVPAWYINSAAVARILIVPALVWSGSAVAPSFTSASTPSSSGGCNGRVYGSPSPSSKLSSRLGHVCWWCWLGSYASMTSASSTSTPPHVHIRDRVHVLLSLLPDILGRHLERAEVVKGVGEGGY